ncbi:hypothetical protein [Spiroplasma endosymbiont of Labia minor]|uniref:hypothetical protein n=1 Tax=Spiroplasma endosymbiont of Labia minor TaxID=3066305 RepID=UPI0030D4F25F
MNKKYDYKIDESWIYSMDSNQPKIINLQPQKFITITGKGSPNDDEYKEKSKVLYSIAHYIKNIEQKPQLWFNYEIWPLEIFWTLTDDFNWYFDQSRLIYKMMIKQPDFVNADMLSFYINQFIDEIGNKEIASQVKLEIVGESMVSQILHTGYFETEPKTFAILDEWLYKQGFARIEKNIHKEIYLINSNNNDQTFVPKTILRSRVKQKEIK